jgi:hypothetical protein
VSSTKTCWCVVPASADRKQLIQDVQSALGVTSKQAAEIVTAFDDIVAKPLEVNLANKRGRDLAKRNPLIYTARGVRTVDEWVDRTLADWETSAIEGHIGTWMEEVARIVSGGFKPGSGVDLQIERPGAPRVVELYAIQTANNTKSAGGKASDVRALRQGAAALRASKRVVEPYVGVMHGRATSSPLGSDPGITILGSDEFWEKISGINGFRPRLLRASTILSVLIRERAKTEVTRIRNEARAIFGDTGGNLKLDVLANPPPARPKRSPPS